MVNISNTTTYINLTKLSEFNETIPTPTFSSWQTVITDIYAVFVTYDVLQWFLSFVVFIALFILLRKETFLNLTDTQVLTLSCFVVVAMNGLLLFYNIFSIIQPIQLFFVIWLIGVLFIAAKN